MAQSSFPFENVDTTETQFSQMFRTLNAGVNGTPAGTELKVSAGTGLQVSVALGQAMVRGHYYISTATELLTIGTANPSNPRIDTVVLRLDPVANSIVLAVVAGTAAASPVAPTLTQTDAGVFEFPLANVAVAAGAGTVGAITDRRVFMGKRLQSVGTSAARDIVFPAPVQGDMVWRDDLGVYQTYYGLFNSSTNVGGRDVAGWYDEEKNHGFVPIRPTSVTFVVGSGTANSVGVISFTGVQQILLQGIFSSKYRNYKVVFDAVKASGSTASMVYIRLLSGSTAAVANYANGFNGIEAGYTTATNVNQTTLGAITYLNGSTQFTGGEMTIFRPNIATATYVMADSLGFAPGNTLYRSQAGVMHNVSSAYDGLVFALSDGDTFTGKVQVFGILDN